MADQVPISHIADMVGINRRFVYKWVQRFLQAKAAPGLARPSWYVVADLSALLGERSDHYAAADVFAALASSRSDFAGMSYESLGLRGQIAGAGAPAGAAS